MNFDKFLWDSEMFEDIINHICNDNKKLISSKKIHKLYINFNRFLKYPSYLLKGGTGIYNPNSLVGKNEKNIDIWKKYLNEAIEASKAGKRIINSNFNRKLLNETKRKYNSELSKKHLHYLPANIKLKEQVVSDFLNASCVSIIESKIEELDQVIFAIKSRIRELSKKQKQQGNGEFETVVSDKKSKKIPVDNEKKENKIKNLRINRLLNLKKSVLVSEESKFTALKSYRQYSDFYENYEKSLKIIEKLGTNITYSDLIRNMALLKTCTAMAIAQHLNLIRTYEDEQKVSRESISSLIKLYEKAYDIFEKNMKKLSQEQKKLLVEAYKKESNVEIFSISDFSKESMMELSKKYLIDYMADDKYLYEIGLEKEILNKFLSPISLIVDRAKYLSLEEVGEIYKRISHDLLMSEPSHSYDKKQLQINFINAIFILMKHRGIIGKDEKLSVKLEAEICSKYLNSYLEKENSKKVLT